MKPEEINDVEDVKAALKIVLSVEGYNLHAEALEMITHRVLEIGYLHGRRWMAKDIANKLGLLTALNGD